MSLNLVDGRGTSIRLGRELGRGGEGAVCEVGGQPGLVAKIYHATPDAEKAAKLVAMATGCNARLSNIAAWPLDVVQSTSRGPIRGFLMRRVERQKDIHILYGPKTRLRDYPEATYRFLVHVAANLARAFAVIHEHQHVIGDVNQGGVCVSPQGTVTLVDCDSFQIAAGASSFRCDVGIPMYQPPELQNVTSFRGLSRSANHDNFGLAVLIFQTLFMARHPYAGAFQGAGEMQIEQAIREFRFAYGRDASARLMKQPPGTLGLGSVPNEVAVLFERAFLEDGARGKRPKAIEWVNALDAFASGLRDCARNPAHAHISSNCFLCELEARVGVVLFVPVRLQAPGAPSIGLEDLWHDIGPVLSSAQVPDLANAPEPQLDAPAAVIEFARARRRARLIAWLGVAVSLLLAAWHPFTLLGLVVFPLMQQLVRGPAPEESRHAKERLQAAQERLALAIRQLERERVTSPLPSLQSRAETLYQGLRQFQQRRSQRLSRLEQGRYGRQLGRYLDQFEVKDSRIKGIGQGLYATLMSNGIETADDLTEASIASVSGFGPKRVSALLAWRRNLESQFKFNPADPGDVRDRGRLEQELQIEYTKELAELQRVAAQIRAHAAPLGARVAILVKEVGQAKHELALRRATVVVLGKAA